MPPVHGLLCRSMSCRVGEQTRVHPAFQQADNQVAPIQAGYSISVSGFFPRGGE